MSTAEELVVPLTEAMKKVGVLLHGQEAAIAAKELSKFVDQKVADSQVLHSPKRR